MKRIPCLMPCTLAGLGVSYLIPHVSAVRLPEVDEAHWRYQFVAGAITGAVVGLVLDLFVNYPNLFPPDDQRPIPPKPDEDYRP